MSSKYRIIPLGGGGGITPTGTLEIRSEGIFDVTDYASVDVDIFDDTTTKSITNNGTYNASDDHVLGYSQVTVAVPASAVDTGTKQITANGSNQDVVGYAAVDVAVVPVLQNKTVTPTTSQQTVEKDSGQGYDGLGTVTINGVTSAIDANIIAENIRDGVTILGVTGTYTGGALIDPQDFLHFYNPSAYSSVDIGIGPYNQGTGAVLYYSTDPTVPTSQWTRWQFDGGVNDKISVGPGETLYLYGNNPVGIPIGMFSGNASFVANGSVECHGNVMSLLSMEDKTAAPAYAFSHLFQNCPITTVPDLPATILGQCAYEYMFANCSYITSLPADLLPATTLGIACYASMFSGCFGLTSLPSGLLPATTLTQECYISMFSYCQYLSSVPSDFLPATVLESRCYAYMFNSTAITRSPNLPALYATDGCYDDMFANCSNLTTIGTISATTASGNSFSFMFHGCTSLTSVSITMPSTLALGRWSHFEGMFENCTSLASVNPNMLPATTLEGNAYYGMFSGCTSLTHAPKLPATVLGSNCYGDMFNGCSSLNEIELSFSDTQDQKWYDQDNDWYPFSGNWTYGVAQSGTFKKLGNANIPTNDPNSDMYSGIPENWTVQTVDYFYIKNEAAGPNVFTLNTPNPDYLSTDLAYSLDGSTWTLFQKGSGITTQTVNMSQGDKLYLRSSTGFATVAGVGSFSPITITCSDLFSAHGDLRTLIDYTNPSGVTSIPQGSFYKMFYGTGYLTEVDCTLNGVTSLPMAAFAEFAGDTTSRSTPLTRARILMPDVTSVYGIALTPSAGSFYRAFNFRNSLAEITLPNLQTWNENGFKNWLAYVSATGTAYAPSGVTIPSDANGIPSGWARIDY